MEVRLPPGRRFLPESPLQPGADVYVAEAPGGRWLHVRIEFREYSVPIDVAEHVLVEPPADGSARRGQPPPTPTRCCFRAWSGAAGGRPAGR